MAMVDAFNSYQIPRDTRNVTSAWAGRAISACSRRPPLTCMTCATSSGWLKDVPRRSVKWGTVPFYIRRSFRSAAGLIWAISHVGRFHEIEITMSAFVESVLGLADSYEVEP